MEGSMWGYLDKALFMVLFLASATGLVWFISRGWRELAKAYPLMFPFSGKRWFFETGAIAGARYGGLLIAGGDLPGAYFATCLPSAVCPPLFIPWDEIKGVERKGFLVRSVELRFAKQPDEEHWISGRVADRLEKVSCGTWKYQRAEKKILPAYQT
jgi:hypothetical protein